MKIEWQAEDIQPGRIIGKPDRIERWMIGYFGDAQRGQEDRYALVSMSDGMIALRMDAQSMATQLNKTGDIPIEFFSDPSHSPRGERPELLPRSKSASATSCSASKRW